MRSSNGNEWRKAKARLRARRDECWICRAFGRPAAIDYSAPRGDPRAFTADHLVPVSRGGALYDPQNLAAAHAACNNWRKNKSVTEVLALAAQARSGGAEALCTTTDW